MNILNNSSFLTNTIDLRKVKRKVFAGPSIRRIPNKDDIYNNTIDLASTLKKNHHSNYVRIKPKHSNYDVSPNHNDRSERDSLHNNELPSLIINNHNFEHKLKDPRYGSVTKKTPKVRPPFNFSPDRKVAASFHQNVQLHQNRSHNATANIKVENEPPLSIFEKTIKNILVSPKNIKNQLNKSKLLSSKIQNHEIYTSRNKNLFAIKTDSILNYYLASPNSKPAEIDNSIDPSAAVSLYRKNLPDYEKEEIMNYPHIYYIGNVQAKLISVNQNEPNGGWDNSKGFYILKAHDHIQYRYEVISLIGKGSFGHVFKCIDHKTKIICAIKILRNKQKFHLQGKIEIDILKKLNQSDNNENTSIVKLLDHFVFRNHIV